MPEVTAIPVKQTSWKIPRTDPVKHFSAQRFAEVIADTADPHPSKIDASRVEFLWLDAACIDQTPGSHEKAQEIGRQGKIFRGAAQVFVWLTTHDRAFYNSWAFEMDHLFNLMVGPGFNTKVDTTSWCSKITQLMSNLIDDHWFSSL